MFRWFRRRKPTRQPSWDWWVGYPPAFFEFDQGALGVVLLERSDDPELWHVLGHTVATYPQARVGGFDLKPNAARVRPGMVTHFGLVFQGAGGVALPFVPDPRPVDEPVTFPEGGLYTITVHLEYGAR